MRPSSTGPAHARVLHDLDLLALWPTSIVGGNEVKVHSPAGSRFEVKSGAPAGAQGALRDRPGLPTVVGCSTCRLPAAALVPGPLRNGEAVICARCIDATTDGLDEHLATIDPTDLDAAAELTPEEEFDRALADEQDGTCCRTARLVEADQDPQRDGLAWSSGQRCRSSRGERRSGHHGELDGAPVGRHQVDVRRPRRVGTPGVREVWAQARGMNSRCRHLARPPAKHDHPA